jgi:hypothetical protein
VDVKPRRIEVEIGSLAVDDPALASRRAEITSGLERELARLAAAGPPAEGLPRGAGEPTAQSTSAAGVGEAIARSVARELPR